MRRIIAGGFVLSLCLSFMAVDRVQTAADPARVTIDTGALHGVVSDDVVSYLGIPFAAPPVGDLRWRAPRPPARWQGERAAESVRERLRPAPEVPTSRRARTVST